MLGSRTVRSSRNFYSQHKTRQAQDLRECARMLGISADEFRNALLAMGTQQDAARDPQKRRTSK